MIEWISDYAEEYEWLTSYKAVTYEEEWLPVDIFGAFYTLISKENIYSVSRFTSPSNFKT